MCFYLRRRAARNQRPVGPGEWGVPPTTLSTSRSRCMPHPPRDRRGRRTRTPQRRRETRRVSGRTAFSWFAARSNESSLPVNAIGQRVFCCCWNVRESSLGELSELGERTGLFLRVRVGGSYVPLPVQNSFLHVTFCANPAALILGGASPRRSRRRRQSEPRARAISKNRQKLRALLAW